jgi:hypothetical protein
VGIGAGTADSSAVLDISSTTKGFLPPRMTMAQISMIAAPANGLIVFCTTDNKFYTYLTASMVWKEISYGSGTIAPSCGYVITKNHVAGTVAPVTKTVTYGTITNLPGETSKCWITSNLGASHVSASVNDTTEASAGWYWQFNRKQGYQYGASRLPASTWIINITESYDWLSANDPCSIELGAAWHVPAYSEWNNLINGGIWEYDMDAWGSGLKLHDAGYLLNTNGNLTSRGTIGQYWSSVMGGSTTAMVLTIGAGTAMTGPNNKTYGFSIRCVKPD